MIQHVASQNVGSAEDRQLLEGLRRGEEAAFTMLVDRHHAGLLRLARVYLQSQAAAEDVVQETWLGVLQGVDRFEGRSSLKTWIFRILMNRARTRAEREARMVPFSALADEGTDSAAEAEPIWATPEPFQEHWSLPRREWDRSPEEDLLSREARAQIQEAVDALPANQREVITLRDIEQWTSQEVCNVLEITETNQRVLLHRARTKVRQALTPYLQERDARDRKRLQGNELRRAGHVRNRLPGRGAPRSGAAPLRAARGGVLELQHIS